MSHRLRQLDAKLAQVVSSQKRDELLDERSGLMQERDRGFRVVDRRRIRKD